MGISSGRAAQGRDGGRFGGSFVAPYQHASNPGVDGVEDEGEHHIESGLEALAGIEFPADPPYCSTWQLPYFNVLIRGTASYINQYNLI